ncbi:MAG TPA: polysaccharide deacetylase family protein [Rectinemataceae bacterium]|nr:polysaccharide deacetylase family protein [Rectinemataceae bacterium]
MSIKTVGFYKKLILIIAGLIILIPTITCFILGAQNVRMRKKIEATAFPPDDIVTVGATQLEPAGVARDKPVLSYQVLYPDLNANFYGFKEDLAGNKTVFLTFDDGPSTGTDEVLGILKKQGVKATFFVNGKSNRVLTDKLKHIANEGHAIGMHSYSHRYNVIYESMESFLDDFYRNFLYIKSETGKAPEILRFPGGSINIFNITNYQSIVAEVLRRGFIYYDWNVSAGDAITGTTTQSVIDNVVNGVRLCWGPAIVLMHDNGKPALLNALNTIIETLAKDGYEFRILDNSIKPPMFIYPD